MNSVTSTFDPFANVEIPRSFDPFAEAEAEAEAERGSTGTDEFVHIRVQQRNGKKCLTSVQGLKKNEGIEQILKYLRKELCCNGNVVEDKELGNVIQLQGDHRKNVSRFLVEARITKKEQIKIHGF